jgi:hypothetical protein
VANVIITIDIHEVIDIAIFLTITAILIIFVQTFLAHSPSVRKCGKLIIIETAIAVIA